MYTLLGRVLYHTSSDVVTLKLQLNLFIKVHSLFSNTSNCFAFPHTTHYAKDIFVRSKMLLVATNRLMLAD